MFFNEEARAKVRFFLMATSVGVSHFDAVQVLRVMDRYKVWDHIAGRGWETIELGGRILKTGLQLNFRWSRSKIRKIGLRLKFSHDRLTSRIGDQLVRLVR